MKTIKTEELKDNKYKKILETLPIELAQIVETAAAETGVREDVLLALKEVRGIEGVVLYDFLIDHFYGAEWYELFGKIMKEKENGERYLQILKEISANGKISAAEAGHVYQNTDSEYGFHQVCSDPKKLDKI